MKSFDMHGGSVRNFLKQVFIDYVAKERKEDMRIIADNSICWTIHSPHIYARLILYDYHITPPPVSSWKYDLIVFHLV